MNILYLTYDGLNDPLGQSQILPYLYGLADKGHKITVISFEKGKIGNQKSEMGNGKLRKSKLKVIPLQYHKSPPVLSTLFDMYLLRKEVKKVLKWEEIDIIHCRSYITSLVGLWAKRKYGVKFIFDMRGFWADERVEGGLWNLYNPIFQLIYKFFKRKELQFLREADATVSLTQNAKREIEQQILPGTDRLNNATTQQLNISVIPTCADFQLLDPGNVSTERSNKLKAELGIEQHDFVLLYLGSLGTWYMLEEMLDFYSQLKHQKAAAEKAHPLASFESIKFLFVTREDKVLRESMERKGMQRQEIIITSSGRQEVPNYISLCHASIFFILPTFSKKASAATKMGETLAMGKPVITNTGWGDVDGLIHNGNGALVDEFNEGGYKIAIQRFFTNWPFATEKIREDAKRIFSLKTGVERYDKIYQQLSANK